MNMQVFTKQDNRRNTIMVIGIAVLTVIGLYLFCPSVFANTNADTMITSVVQIIATLCTVVGVILGIVGLVKFIIAHANEQGPEQQKAIMWIAVAIILIIVPNIISTVATNWSGLINDGVNYGWNPNTTG